MKGNFCASSTYKRETHPANTKLATFLCLMSLISFFNKRHARKSGLSFKLPPALNEKCLEWYKRGECYNPVRHGICFVAFNVTFTSLFILYDALKRGAIDVPNRIENEPNLKNT
jgi:hypothetical protein